MNELLDSLTTAQPTDLQLERIIEAAISRLQDGQSVDIDQLVAENPEHAAALRDLFPAVKALVRLAESPSPPRSEATNNNDTGLPYDRLGDFRLIREIGRGGMATVFEAEQLSMGRLVALKALPFASLIQDQSLQRFRNEVRAAASLNHPHIVSIYSVGDERGVHFYAMQLIRGQTLADTITKLRTCLQNPAIGWEKNNGDGHSRVDSVGTSLPAAFVGEPARWNTTNGSRPATDRYRIAATLGVQAAEALQHAHHLGVLHRDIKPSNLLLDTAGKLYVTDFGLARIGADAGLTRTGDVVGTLCYMAPEQALATGVIDHRADIYSLGATLYELLTLQRASGETDRAVLLQQIAVDEPLPLRKIDRQIPTELETIVLKAVAKLPDERYQTAQQLAEDLQAFLEHRPIQARPASMTQRLRKWSRRHQTLVRTAGLAFVLLMVLQAISMAFMKRAKTQALAALEVTSALLYAADMNVAYDTFEKGWSDEVEPILNRQLPVGGESDRRGLEWHLLHTLVQPPGSIEFAGHVGPVNEIALFPDQKKLASVGDDGTLRIWDLRLRKLLTSLKLDDGPIYSVAVSQDGRFVAAGSKTLYLCDRNNQDRVKQIFHSEHNFESLAFRSDGACIAAGSRYHDVFLITLLGKLVGRIPCDSRVESLEFVEDEQLLLLPNRDPLSSSRIGVAQFWRDDLSAVQQELVCALGNVTGNITVARSRTGGRYVLTGERNRSRTHFFDRESGRIVATTHRAQARLNDLASSPDGKAVAIAYQNGVVEYHQVRERDGTISFGDRPRVFKTHRGETLAVRFVSSDQLATCGADGLLKVWNLRETTEVAHDFGDSRFFNIDLSPDGKSLLYTHLGGYAIVESSTGKVVDRKRIPTAFSGGTAWTPDGGRIAVCLQPAKNRSVRIFDRLGEQRCSIDHQGAPNAVAFSPTGELIAVIGDERLQVCNAESGAELTQKPLAANGIAIAFSHDGKRIAYGGSFDNVVLCSPSTLESERELTGATSTRCIAFSPDDTTLATGHGDGFIRLWDVATGQLRAELMGHERSLQDVTFSPDGRTLLSAAKDRSVRFWSVVHARSFGGFHLVGTVTAEPTIDLSCRVSLSPDGRRLAVGYETESADRPAVQTWNIDPSGRE